MSLTRLYLNFQFKIHVRVSLRERRKSRSRTQIPSPLTDIQNLGKSCDVENGFYLCVEISYSELSGASCQ